MHGYDDHIEAIPWRDDTLINFNSQTEFSGASGAKRNIKKKCLVLQLSVVLLQNIGMLVDIFTMTNYIP